MDLQGFNKNAETSQKRKLLRRTTICRKVPDVHGAWWLYRELGRFGCMRLKKKQKKKQKKKKKNCISTAQV